MEHASYVGAMLGMAYIRLHHLLAQEGIEPAPPRVASPALAPGHPKVQEVASRIANHAEHLARTIAWGNGGDWKGAFGRGGAIYDLIHRTIDEATEHLLEAREAACQAVPAGDRARKAPPHATTDFSAVADEVAGTTVVSLRGELDLSSRPELRRVLDVVTEAGPAEVVIDLRDLTFADGAGVSELARAWRQAALGGRRLTLRGPSNAVRKVLGLSRLDRLMVIEPASGGRGGAEIGRRCHRGGQPEKT